MTAAPAHAAQLAAPEAAEGTYLAADSSFGSDPFAFSAGSVIIGHHLAG